jgi:hypothetical protein
MRELNVSKNSLLTLHGSKRSRRLADTIGMSRCADDRGPETSPIALSNTETDRSHGDRLAERFAYFNS